MRTFENNLELLKMQDEGEDTEPKPDDGDSGGDEKPKPDDDGSSDTGEDKESSEEG